MHKGIILRGNGTLIRRVIEDLKDVHFNFINKETKKSMGIIQLMPREIKTFELIFPETEKKNIKKIVNETIAKHNTTTGGVAAHWLPFKKDKFKEGVEML